MEENKIITLTDEDLYDLTPEDKKLFELSDDELDTVSGGVDQWAAYGFPGMKKINIKFTCINPTCRSTIQVGTRRLASGLVCPVCKTEYLINAYFGKVMLMEKKHQIPCMDTVVELDK